jgi:predicted nucleotidyltransferase
METDTITPTDWLPTITDRIVRSFRPERIVLFGSCARGDTNSDSDVDLLVVLSVVANKRRAAIVGTVLRAALQEGKILYERDRAA